MAPNSRESSKGKDQGKDQSQKYLRFVNSTRGGVLAERVVWAKTVFARFKGLLGTKELVDGRGLLLDPCNGIHMFWMTYSIDAIFLDRDYKVVGLVHNIKPWALSAIYKTARTCLELPGGTISKSGTSLGDVLTIEPLSD